MNPTQQSVFSAADSGPQRRTSPEPAYTTPGWDPSTERTPDHGTEVAKARAQVPVSIDVAQRDLLGVVLLESEVRLLLGMGAAVSLALATALLGASITILVAIMTVSVSPSATQELFTTLGATTIIGGLLGMHAWRAQVAKKRMVERLVALSPERVSLKKRGNRYIRK